MVARAESTYGASFKPSWTGVSQAWRRVKETGQKARIKIARHLEKPPTPGDRTPIDTELTPELLEHWRELPRRIDSYSAGITKDGFIYPGGRILSIGNEQVMDDFEQPWVNRTVDLMWEGIRAPQIVGERGFGLGLMSSAIHEKQVKYQKSKGVGNQQHVIAELNRQVWGDAVNWAGEMLETAEKEGRKVRVVSIDDKGNEIVTGHAHEPRERNVLEIRVINGDADAEMLKFPDQYFDQIYSDTHQLKPEHMGIHDVLKFYELKQKLKQTGAFTFLVWHRNNQTTELDQNQLARISGKDFRKVTMDLARAVVHENSEYLEEGEHQLPAYVMRFPNYTYRHAA